MNLDNPEHSISAPAGLMLLENTVANNQRHYVYITELVLGLHPVVVFKETPPLIGWAQT